jgi:ubiquinone biosynthesis protein
MNEQVGWRGFIKALKSEAPKYATLLPQLPRLLHQQLSSQSAAQLEAGFKLLLAQQARRNQLMMVGLVLMLVVAVAAVFIAVKVAA